MHVCVQCAHTRDLVAVMLPVLICPVEIGLPWCLIHVGAGVFYIICVIRLSEWQIPHALHAYGLIVSYVNNMVITNAIVITKIALIRRYVMIGMHR